MLFLRDKLKKMLAALIVFLMIHMLFWTTFQVFTRYVLNQPSIFTEELLRFNLIYLGLLGAAYGFIVDAHLSLIFFKNKIKDVRIRKYFSIFLDLLSLGFVLLVLVIGGLDNVSDNVYQRSPILKVSMGYVYSIVPLCGILICLIILANIEERIRRSD